ncbi:MAG: glycosyltransferase family 39 protein [Chloroflexi bacterium]|nr:glycosyltransferase family 39 protein [Chloroflexota bacterium]
MTARHFTLLRLLLLTLYVAMLLHSHAFSLPYVDHPDEPALYLAGQVWLGKFEMGRHMRGYPPGYIALELLVSQLLEWLGFPEMSQTVNVMRWIAVAVSAGTLWLIFSAAREAAGDWASLVAGGAWISSPLVVSHSVYATTDPFVCFTTAWSLWLSITALRRERPHFALLAMLVGALAVLIKLMVVPALLAGVTALLFGLRNRRLRARLLAGQLGIVAITAFLVLGVLRLDSLLTPYEDSLPESEIGIIRREGAQSMLYNLANVQRILNNIRHVFVPVQELAALPWLLSGAVAWLAARSARLDWRAILLCLIAVFATPWVMSSFTAITLQRARDVLPAVTALCVLIGMSAVQIWRALPSNRAPRALYSAAIAAWIALVLLPSWRDTLALVEERGYPDWRTELRRWADVNLEAGWVAVPIEHEKTFNPFWSGLQGAQWFNWLVYRGDFTERPLTYWRAERGIAYALLSADFVRHADAAQRAYLDQMLRLKTFAAPPRRRGPETVVFRTTPIQMPIEASFDGQIDLLGIDLVRDGQAVRVRAYWQAKVQPQRDYSLYLHLTPLDSRQVLAQQDGPPKAKRPTTSWQDADERIIGDWFTVQLPEQCGVRLLAGLYDWASGQRLLLPDGADHIELWRLPCS